MPLSFIVTWILAYIVTNLDDLLLLTLFFAHPKFRTRNIIIGEYTGIATILGTSLLIAVGTIFLPQEWIGFFGIVPILIGVRFIYQDDPIIPINSNEKSEIEDLNQITTIPFGSNIVSSDIYLVWVITVVNSSDNLSVYVPLLRTHNFEQIWIICIVFAILVGVWCVLGRYAQQHPDVSRFLRRYNQYLLPYTLIVLGVYILGTSGPLSLIFEFVQIWF